MRCALIGNYGVGNLGDEALREYFLDRFPQIDWIVLSASPRENNEVPRLPFGLRSLFSTRWRGTVMALRTADAVVFGGGSLFTDVESVSACLLWWWHAVVARVLGKPIYLAFQGIGPFRTRLGERCARWVVARAVFLSVRDEESAKRIRDWKGGDRAIISFDPVLSLMTDEPEESSEIILAVIPRANVSLRLTLALRKDLDERKPQRVKILSLQPDSASERDVCEIIAKELDIPVSVHPIRSLGDLQRELACCSAVITQRFHGALGGIALGIPTGIVEQGPGDKLSSLRAMIADMEGLEDLRTLVRKGEQALRRSLFD